MSSVVQNEHVTLKCYFPIDILHFRTEWKLKKNEEHWKPAKVATFVLPLHARNY